MNETIKLYIDLQRLPDETSADAFAWMAGADALVIEPCRCTVEQFESMPVETAVLLNGDPVLDAPWQETAGQWICDRGLEATARLQDLHPALQWIPRLSVSRAQVSYRFSGPAFGEGFSFYMPDTAAIQGWREEGSDRSLGELLSRATELGFADLWLHSPEAASSKSGLALELLDKTQGGPWAIWLSGGVADARHLRNLARLDGATTVVVDEAVAQQCSLAALREALIPETPRPEAVPVTFAPRGTALEH